MAADEKGAAPEGAAEEKPRDIGPDGEKIKDMEYYDLLGVRGDASDLDLKKAYRKAAIKYHPDKNPGNVEAEKKFVAIGEAMQILSDSQERAYYNKHGKKDRSQPGMEMEDPGKVFATMFGGEKFKDWIGEISLGKDIGKAFEVSTTEEEREQMKQEWAESQNQPQQSTIHGQETPSSDAEKKPSSPGPDGGAATPQGAPKPGEKPTSPAPGEKPTSAPGPSNQKPGKMTAEQKAEMEKYEDQRRVEQQQRVEHLTKSLKDRLRPFVEANENPTTGDGAKVEVERWEKQIRQEAEDLKLESFGVELLKLIGSVYVSKATTYLRLHGSKSFFANFLGVPSFLASTRAKGKLIKEAWGMLSSTVDVQRAMSEMERRQEKGEVPEDEMEQLNKDLVGKLLLISWKGTRFESGAVLREVVDNVLRREPGVTDVQLAWRAKGLIVIGAIFKAVEPDESDEERRELERLVAEASQSRKKDRHRKKGASPADTPRGPSVAGPQPASASA